MSEGDTLSRCTYRTLGYTAMALRVHCRCIARMVSPLVGWPLEPPRGENTFALSTRPLSLEGVPCVALVYARADHKATHHVAIVMPPASEMLRDVLRGAGKPSDKRHVVRGVVPSKTIRHHWFNPFGARAAPIRPQNRLRLQD
jgi:hypothetical protein